MQLAKVYPVTSDQRIADIEASVSSPLQKQPTIVSSSQAINSNMELIIITAGSAATLTLTPPTVGNQLAGGDDGKELSILSTTAFAHVVSAGSNKINGNKATATFSAAVGNLLELYAYNGVWYQRPSTGITLS